MKKQNGITLVALIATIIVLLILAGISVNLIGGTNGILSRAQQAASKAELAKLSESKELSDAAVLIDMYADGETYKTLYDYIKDKCDENGATGGDKILETENGSYWLDDENNLYYKDKDTEGTAKLLQDANGNLSIKEVTDKKGNVQDMTTEDSIKSEIDSAMTDLKKEWQESGSTEQFNEWLENKCEENGGSITTSTGGTIASNGDGTFSYGDSTANQNVADITVDKNGKVEVENVEINKPESGGNAGGTTTLPVKDLTESDITFDKKIAGTDDWNADWINQSVVVTAVTNTDLTGYTLQTSKNNVTWKNVDNQTFTTNGTFYVRAFNGKRFGKSIQTDVTNIDKKAPEIAVETTTNSYKITVTDEISKIAGYKITETAGEPENFDPVDLQESFTTTGEGTPGQTFYAWAKDKAGNVTTKEFTLKEIPAVSNNDFNYTYEPEGWTNQDVLVTAELKNSAIFAGFTVQTSKDGANWESDNAQNFTENGKMFVRLVDNKENPGRTTAEAIVDKIDKVDPSIDTVTATTKSYQFEASDEGSGLAGYQITETEEEPASFIPIANSVKSFTSPIMENQKNNRPYYIWLKDVAGNVIYKKVDLKAVDSATSTNISVKSTTWSGTSATVTFETTSSYQMQICTKASKNDEDWESRSVVTVESGTPIYVRLWDGVNGGNYYTHKPVITYQVKYNANGGSGTMANSMHEYGTVKALTANGFAKTGYTFAGWSTTAGGAKAYDNQASVTNLSSTNGDTVNLFAVWTANTNTAYKVVHQQMNVSGSGYTAVETENKTGTSDANVTPPVKTYTGFTSPSAQTVKVAADGSTTVTYKYTRNKYRFTLGSGTGVSTSGSSGTADYFFGATITLKATASAGYTWKQWISSNAGLVGNTTTANTTFTMPAEAVTMTPNATAYYNITYNYNGGTAGNFKPTKAEYGTTIQISNPTRTGYTFAGWIASSGLNTGTACYGTAANSASTSWGNANTKITAQWFKNLSATPGATVNLKAFWYSNTAKYFVKDSKTTVAMPTSASETLEAGYGTLGNYFTTQDVVYAPLCKNEYRYLKYTCTLTPRETGVGWYFMVIGTTANMNWTQAHGVASSLASNQIVWRDNSKIWNNQTTFQVDLRNLTCDSFYPYAWGCDANGIVTAWWLE